MVAKLLIRRGDGRHDIVLEDGEMVFDRLNKCFYVGDGKTSMLDLKEFNNVVEGDDGKVYLVRVDESGNPIAEHMVARHTTQNINTLEKRTHFYEFYTKE